MIVGLIHTKKKQPVNSWAAFLFFICCNIRLSLNKTIIYSFRWAFAALPFHQVLQAIIFLILIQTASSKNEDKNASKPSKKNEEYNLLIAPVRLSDVISPSFNPNDIQPIHPVAGEAFTVFVAIVDDQNRVIDVDGDFQFKWSSHNYINPDKPDNKEKLEGADGWFDLTNGTAIIANIRYDEVGVIMLSGMARFRAGSNDDDKDKKDKKKDKDDEDDDKGKTTVIFGNSDPFLVQPFDFRIRVIPRAVDDEGRIFAGDPFSLIITPVNGRGETLENFSQTLSNSTQISLISRVTEPANATVHTVYDAEGNVVDSIPSNYFRDGSATLRDLYFNDAGVLELQILITNYFGMTITGSSVEIGRFIPKQIEMEIAQPAVSGGEDAQYNYSGQPFYATVTISALNNRTPPGRTHNYQERGDGTFSLALQQSDRSLGTLVYDASQAKMTAGEKLIYVTASLQFQSTQTPQLLRLEYSYENNADDLSLTGLSPETEFRSGRIRFRHRSGTADMFLAIRPEIEHYSDQLWKLNEDEDILTLNARELEIKEQGTGANIHGSMRQFYGGRIRGGTEPFEVIMQNIVAPVQFSVGLKNGSALSFLGEVSEPWLVVPESSGSVFTNRVFVYETEN